MQANTDVERLGQHLRLPVGVRRARWILRALGVADPEVPGPTDTVLTAQVELDEAGWAALAAHRRGGQGVLALHADVAHALLAPTTPLPAADAPEVLVAGESYDLAPFASVWERAGDAVRYKDALVLQLFSR